MGQKTYRRTRVSLYPSHTQTMRHSLLSAGSFYANLVSAGSLMHAHRTTTYASTPHPLALISLVSVLPHTVLSSMFAHAVAARTTKSHPLSPWYGRHLKKVPPFYPYNGCPLKKNGRQMGIEWVLNGR